MFTINKTGIKKNSAAMNKIKVNMAVMETENHNQTKENLTNIL